MLEAIRSGSLATLVEETIPEDILERVSLDLDRAGGEHELLDELESIAETNDAYRSFIGMGYRETVTPPVIQRNILENPKWYTHYTPYQSELSQGRLEALLNFQTMVSDLTGLEIANASLLDEATAAAEAMTMLRRGTRARGVDRFWVAEDCHPQTIAVVESRAEPLDLDVVVAPPEEFEFDDRTFGILLQYPSTDGAVRDYADLCERAHDEGAYVAVAADLLSLTLLEAPGEFGADVAIGNTQRFGVPLGYGGPHAAYCATTDNFKRELPGRLIGVSKDERGEIGLRTALQTREQHIRREKATSNICTAQVLLAVMAGTYGVYHGPEGLRAIAEQIHQRTEALAEGLDELGYEIRHEDVFDTLRFDPPVDADEVRAAADERHLNLRDYDDGTLGLSLDEATTLEDLEQLLEVFEDAAEREAPAVDELLEDAPATYQGDQPRESSYLEHPNFHEYRSETELVRYLDTLAGRDVSLTDHMIPLGSCTMKLNASVELTPITWSEFSQVHPMAPPEQNEGYHELIESLKGQLREMTGLPAISVQPNSGAQGEYAGLLAIQAYHDHHSDETRDACLIPESAHGTNAASAVMAGLEMVEVNCDDRGDVDLEDLADKAEEHADRLAGAMFTYPSTHGIFEEGIQEMCDIVHEHGGLVYLDGANMNAQIGLCRPGDYGVDVCHLNLHKTFSIPHGGGGPGVGPLAAAEHLEPFLPGHPLFDVGGDHHPGPVAAAPWGSAGILPISWSYIRLMGEDGLRRASEVAILNANYMADRLSEGYDILYRGNNGRVGHEFIVDPREFEETADISAQDIAKRLMDYGFHAPTMSWPVHGTLMVEPTESESKEELDRFCEAMLSIREEIRAIEEGDIEAEESPLKHAPHPADVVTADEWERAYSRQEAAFPTETTREDKYWPPVARIDNVWGDRNLMPRCPGDDLFDED